MKTKIKSIIYRMFSLSLGNLLVFFMPKKAERLSKDGLTIINSENKLNFSERLMRNAILKKLEQKKDYSSLEELHRHYWTNKGEGFFSDTQSSFETAFLPNCSFLFDLLEKELKESQENYHTLVEIGTGNGRVLNYLSAKFPAIHRFVGIDLSPVQTTRNNEVYRENNKLEFIAADGFEWVNKNGQGNTIFVTSRGVLEYFTQERLKAFLDKLNGLGKIIFVAIEPKGITHDFDKNSNSEPYGYERSFSHNYPQLFKNAGFQIWHLSFKPHDETAQLGYLGVKN